MWKFIPLLGAIFNFLLVLFVLSRGLRTTVLRVYALLGLCIAVWNLGTYFMFCVHTADGALFWARFLQMGVIFVPLALYHLSLRIGEVPIGRHIYFLYAFFIALALSNLTGCFISGVKNVGYAYYSVAGPCFYVFLSSFSLVFASVFILLHKLRKLSPLHKSRLANLVLAQGILAFLGANDILPIIGIYLYPGTGIPVYPLGSIAAVFYGLMVGYSVFQHQLLDIHITLGKLAAHIVRFVFLFATALTLMLMISAFEPGQFTPFSFFSAIGVLMVSALVATAFFPRLFGGATEFLERRILGDRFEYHDKINTFVASMQWHTDANLLFEDLHELLLKVVRISSYQIILLDETAHYLTVFRCYPDEPERTLTEFNTSSPIYRYFTITKAEVLSHTPYYISADSIPEADEARRQLSEFHAEFCFPFVFQDTYFGFMLLGPKMNEEPYTATDIFMMGTVARNLTATINQIRLMNQVLHAQEQELLGRMSRGMAHDLNNLLTPIGTCLQLAAEGIPTQKLNEELLPMALYNIRTIHAYIREALFFSQNLRPDFQRRQLDATLSNTVELMRNKLDGRKIKISMEVSRGVSLEMDEVLIQRLISNLISNAVDASQDGSEIRIKVSTLIKANSECDWLRVQVIDQGTGIASDNLNRVFMPYFTTKTSGDTARGFGLGLAICRKIAHLHGGSMNILNSEQKGTTVNIDLPCIQAVAKEMGQS